MTKNFSSKDTVGAILLAVVAIAVIIAGVMIVGMVLSKDDGNQKNDNTTPTITTTDETRTTETAPTTENRKDIDKQIAAAIAQAEELAASGDYDAAISQIQTWLKTYSDSEKLQEKLAEYTTARNTRIKEKTLAEAKSFADSGDYVSAIALIKNAQETQGDNAKYQSAFKTYSSAYKTEVIASADALAAERDYIGAIAKIAEVEAVLGGDADLSNKVQVYEDEYVTGIVSQVDAYIKAKDYDTATAIVNEALKVFPENKILMERAATLKNSKPKSLLSVCPPYQTEGYYAEKTYSMMGNVYINGFHLNDNNGGVAYFNLNQEYSLLSFDVGHRDGKQLETGYYYFYLDGELVQTLTLDASMLVQHVEISVEGVSQLLIQGGNWCHCFALVDISLTPNILSKSTTDNQSNTNTEGKHILNICPPYQTEGYYTEKSYSLAGDTYINGFHLNDNKGGIAYFNLDGNYNTLSFDVGHIDGKNLETGYYYFYLDGEPVYTLELDPSVLVQHIEIPLNGATQMIIEGGPWCHCFALVNVRVIE